MWVLQDNVKCQGVVHYLPCGRNVEVGRRSGHVHLTGDLSVSGSHATLQLTHTHANLTNPETMPSVELTDAKSTCGTYINDGIKTNKCIPKGQPATLKDGDQIRFGTATSTWRLKYQKLVVTTSAVRPDTMKAITSALLILGGHCLSKWTSNCQLLVMDGITVTTKAVCALASGCSIVKPDFLTKLAEAVVNRTPLPDPSDFQPPFLETDLTGRDLNVSFTPDERRKRILCGKTFLFDCPKQFKTCYQMVTLAGGSAVQLSEVNYRQVCGSPPTHLLVKRSNRQPNTTQTRKHTQYYVAASNLLREKNYTAISESDIGLVVLTLNTERYCNPSFNILRRTDSASTQQTESMKIYATETQDSNCSAVPLTGTREVPETGSTASRPSPAPIITSMPPPTPLSASPPASNVPKASPSTCTVPTQVTVMQSHQDTDVRKRKRSAADRPECETLEVKRSARCNTATTSATLNNEGVVENHDLLESNFAPHHTSTQMEAACDTNRNNKPTLANDSSTTNLSSIERTLPMVPYTLPSLKPDTQIHDDDTTLQNGEMETQPYRDPAQDDDYRSILDFDYQPGKWKERKKGPRLEENTEKEKRDKQRDKNEEENSVVGKKGTRRPEDKGELREREGGGRTEENFGRGKRDRVEDSEDEEIIGGEKRTRRLGGKGEFRLFGGNRGGEGRREGRQEDISLGKENRMLGNDKGERRSEPDKKRNRSEGEEIELARDGNTTRGREEAGDETTTADVGWMEVKKKTNTIMKPIDQHLKPTMNNVKQECVTQSSKSEIAADPTTQGVTSFAQFRALMGGRRKRVLETPTTTDPSTIPDLPSLTLPSTQGQQSGVADKGKAIKVSGFGEQRDGISIKKSRSQLDEEAGRIEKEVEREGTGFISKKAASTVKRSPSELKETVQRTEDPVGVKREAVDGEVDDLGRTLEKSLLKVEVTSLIHTPTRPPPSSISTSSTLSSSNCINYKRFKKSQQVMMLPRIIGGDDLIAHDHINLRRDSYLRENAEEIQRHEEMYNNDSEGGHESNNKLPNDLFKRALGGFRRRAI